MLILDQWNLALQDAWMSAMLCLLHISSKNKKQKQKQKQKTKTKTKKNQKKKTPIFNQWTDISNDSSKNTT